MEYGPFFDNYFSGGQLRYVLDFLAFVGSFMARNSDTTSICFRFSFMLE